MAVFDQASAISLVSETIAVHYGVSFVPVSFPVLNSDRDKTRQDDSFNSAQFYKTQRLTLHRQLNTVQLRNKRKNVTYNKIGSEL